jgi:hypothetical protein
MVRQKARLEFVEGSVPVLKEGPYPPEEFH